MFYLKTISTDVLALAPRCTQYKMNDFTESRGLGLGRVNVKVNYSGRIEIISGQSKIFFHRALLLLITRLSDYLV